MKIFDIIKDYLDSFIHEFGFSTLTDFIGSSFGYMSQKPVVIISISFAAIGTFVERFIGLTPMVYIAFILLLFLEFFTGIRASLKEGKKIYSKRFGRVVLKLLVYTVLIGVINIFRTELEVPSFFEVSVNIYSWIYYAALNLIVIQLILSVFENLSRLGFEETNKIYGLIAKILHKYVKLISPEGAREEEEKLEDIDFEDESKNDEN